MATQKHWYEVGEEELGGEGEPKEEEREEYQHVPCLTLCQALDAFQDTVLAQTENTGVSPSSCHEVSRRLRTEGKHLVPLL